MFYRLSWKVTVTVTREGPPDRDAMPAGLLTVVDAAGRAGVSVRTLRRWIASDNLAVTKLPYGRVGIPIADLDALIVPVTPTQMEE